MKRLLDGAQPHAGRVRLNIPENADSGARVRLRIGVDSPMTEHDHVHAVHVVAEHNPRPWVGSFLLSPRSGRASLEIFVRLRDSQALVA